MKQIASIFPFIDYLQGLDTILTLELNDDTAFLYEENSAPLVKKIISKTPHSTYRSTPIRQYNLDYSTALNRHSHHKLPNNGLSSRPNYIQKKHSPKYILYK